VVGAPLQRHRQPRTPVDVARVAPTLVPLAGGVGEVAMDCATLGILVQPATQPRPLAQQRLVRHLHRRGAHRQQPALGEHREHAIDVRVGVGLELRERDPPSDDRAANILSSQSQQHGSRNALLRRLQPAESLLRQPRHRSTHTADALVGRVTQAPRVAPLPQLEQGRRQQREGSGLIVDVRQQGVDELRLHVQAGAPGRKLYRPAQLVAPHWPDEHVAGSQQLRQSWVSRASPVEIGPDREHHDAATTPAGHVHERVDERGALGLVTTSGEDLLELVDRQHDVLLGPDFCHRVAQLEQRMLAGPYEHLRPLVAAG
jgi:hypothetical protein